VKLSADEALAAEQEGDGPGRPAVEREEAKAWLLAQLGDQQEHVVDELKKAATAAGLCSWRTVRRASTELRVIKAKSGFSAKWTWRLPKLGRAHLATKSEELSNSTVLATGQMGEI